MVYDIEFGQLRSPSNVYEWENGVSPRSLTKLDRYVGERLAYLLNAVNINLLKHAARLKVFIWAMDEDANIYIAIEELALTEEFTVPGIPKPRGVRSKLIDKKLGHPTLLDGKPARIAGELRFDYKKNGDLCFFINVSSGRYCKGNYKPTNQQMESVAKKFQSFGIEVQIDPL